jgi:transposase
MIDRTTLLFALPGFRVLNVTLDPDGGRLVLVESVVKDGGCPSCGVMSSRIRDRPICRLKDLPHGTVPLRLWVCKLQPSSLSVDPHAFPISHEELGPG